MTLKTADIITALILLGLGALVAVDAVRMGAGWGMEGPKPGFHPFLMAAIIIVGSVFIIRQARANMSKKALGRFVPPDALKPILIVLVPACFMILLTEVVGLYMAGLLYMVAYIRWVGKFSWLVSLAVGVLTPLAFYIIFEKIFLIPMPMGMYGGWFRF